MSSRLTPDPSILERFRAALDPLVGADERIGVAVSGGPDSLALLLLTAAARPGWVEAATIDHGLRDESAAEAGFVSSIAAELGIAHHVLKVHVPSGASLQAQARGARYRALGDWAIDRSLSAVTTAHHADDQAETLLMRLARGAGLSGLAATRRKRVLEPGIHLVRPLLGWRKSELVGIVEAAGLTAVDDPSNRDPRHDRSRFRGLVEQADWADADRLALSAEWLSEADEALEWALHHLAAERIRADGEGLSLEAGDLPREMQRRLLLTAFDRMGAARPRGPSLERAMRSLEAGDAATLSGLKLKGGTSWIITPAPPRRKG